MVDGRSQIRFPSFLPSIHEREHHNRAYGIKGRGPNYLSQRTSPLLHPGSPSSIAIRGSEFRTRTILVTNPITPNQLVLDDSRCMRNNENRSPIYILYYSIWFMGSKVSGIC